MPIDHALNLKLLEALESEYPNLVGVDKLSSLGSPSEVKRSLYYLSEKGHVDINESSTMRGTDVVSAKITAEGIDKIAL